MTFWELTTYEFGLILKQHDRKAKEDQEEKITLAYMTALWTAQWQSKSRAHKHKPLEEILGIEKTPHKRVMTDEEMLKEVKKIHKVLGGD